MAVSTVSAGCLATLEQAECAWDDGAASVFAGLELEVRAGELLVVLGKNGAGKSTLLRAMAGLLPLRQGRATLGGVDCRQLDPRARALRAALVPQELPPLDDVLVFDFVLAGRYARLPRWRAAPEADLAATQAALAACDAAEAACATLGTLSGGARRRVLVARALAQGAPLLLADEPTNALDPEHRLQVFDLLARAAREGHGVVVTTHELDLAGQYADRIVLLDGGRISAQGRPQEVLCPEILTPVYGARLAYASANGGPLVWPARYSPNT